MTESILSRYRDAQRTLGGSLRLRHRLRQRLRHALRLPGGAGLGLGGSDGGGQGTRAAAGSCAGLSRRLSGCSIAQGWRAWGCGA